MAKGDAAFLAGKKYARDGQTLLALMLIIGGLIAATAITSVFLTVSFAASGYGFQAANVAEQAAAGGVEDALLQLDRNPSFATTSTYPVLVASTTANVSVTQNSPTAGYVTILSTAVVSGTNRTIDALLFENATTGEADLMSWQLVL